jgi:hypothetical protein
LEPAVCLEYFFWFVSAKLDSCCPFDGNMNNMDAQVVVDESDADRRHDKDVCSCCSVLVFVTSCPGKILLVSLVSSLVSKLFVAGIIRGDKKYPEIPIHVNNLTSRGEQWTHT